MKSPAPLLERAVRLLELRPEAAGARRARAAKAIPGSSRASLHGKTFVFDAASVFVGSVNLDPRSLQLNTEVGVVAECPELAAEVAALFARWSSAELAYEVTERPDGGLSWTGGFTGEPNAGFWRGRGAGRWLHLPLEALLQDG